MRTAARLLFALVVLLGACGSEIAAAPAQTPAQQLDAAAAANHKYFYVADAILDGYLPAGQCMQSAQGAMGQHYLNSRYFAAVDAIHPPELLYLPIDGTMRLAGVEYFADAT